MIISASRRTDIPAFFSPWLINRVREGFVCTRNPRNPAQTRRIELNPGAVDAIVFWTKNPAPLMDKLDIIRDFMYYFQFTLSPYGSEIERNLPEKAEILNTFRALSREIGAKRVVWRYDPIIVSEKYGFGFHERAFARMAGALEGACQRVVISFLDTSYREAKRNLSTLAPIEIADGQKLALAARLSYIAREHGLEMQACSSALDLSPANVKKARCIDSGLIESLLGRRISASADKHQRANCGCAQSVDIGAYNTCTHGCAYCYASFNAAAIEANTARHDAASPYIIGG